MSEKNNLDQAWSRQAVTFRLSSRRKRELESLASESPLPLSPTSAIDYAISAALAARSASSDDGFSDSATVEELLREISSLIETHAREQRAAIFEIGRQVKDLRDVMMAAAVQSHAADEGACAVSMREWLRAETLSLPEGALLAVAKWQAKSRLDDGSFAIDLLAERIAAPGLSGRSARGLPALVRLSPIESSSPAAKLDSMRSAYLMCQPNAAGWAISIHPMDAHDAPGDSIGMLMA